MIRRVHVLRLMVGSIALDPAEAHHVRDVLRLTAGAPLELFDDAGNVAAGIIRHVNVANVVVDVDTFGSAPDQSACDVTVAAAVPKGDRADWLVEKLTELGVTRYIPLMTERSVVLPAGRNKFQRWERIAIESAKQSRRPGVMTIAPLTPLHAVIASPAAGWFLSTGPGATQIAAGIEPIKEVLLLIGPEGGWSDGEVSQMRSAGLKETRLTSTVLRVETAAVLAAGVVLCRTVGRTAVRPSDDFPTG